MELTPASVLAMWAGGLAACVAVVAWWRIVGPGYVWLGAGVVAGLGIPAAAAGAGPAASVAVGLLVPAVLLARRGPVAAGLLAASAVGFIAAAADDAALLGVASGALLLGTVTGEMILGHWYLVDPRLPRWALRALGVAAIVGVVLDFGALAILGVFPWAGGDLPVGLGFVVLAVTTLVLMVAVRAAIGEEGYSGVMAATGLSYLATLTAVGAAVIGRLVLEGPVL